MKKILATTASFLALTAGPVWSQSYNDPGTDWSNATTEVWTEDEADMLVNMPSTFACIIANSRGDLTPNGTWEALIDEAECFGEVETEDGQGSSAPEYARVKLSSSRASNDDPQIVDAFFDSVDGDHYIARITMRDGPSESNPLGSWYFAFYGAGTDSNSITVDNATNYGFVDITESGGDVTISSADVFGLDGTASVIKYNSANDTVTFGGVLASTNPGMPDSFIAGKMNGNSYYRVRFNTSGNDFDAQAVLSDLKDNGPTAVAATIGGLVPQTSSGQCFNFENEWESIVRYGVYDANGAKVNLSGGFSFETDEATPVYGYMGNWGVWLESSDALFSPSVSNTTNVKAINANVGGDSPVSRNLEWAGGELFQISTASYTMDNGDVFISYTASGPVRAVWNGTNFDLYQIDNPTQAATPSSLSSAADMYSPKLQQNVKWDGSAGTVSYTQEESVAAASVNGLVLKNLDTNVPTDTSRLPITASEYATNSSTNINTTETVSDKTYILSSRNETGYEDRTLYYDADDSGTLTSGDEPVRFDFSYDGSQATPYGGTAASYNGFWPYERLRLHADSAACTSDVNSQACVKYVWRYGASEWDHSIIATDADGVVTIDKPLRFEYTHASANERNGSNSLTFESPDPNNPIAHTANGTNYTVDNTTFDGDKFMLEYNGSDLYGLPWAPAGGSDYAQWVSMINLSDGTNLETADETDYYVHALEVARSLKADADNTQCQSEGVFFNTVNPLDTSPGSVQLGLSITDIPNVANETAYPRPTAVWSDAPDDNELACTVTHGDGSACVSE